METYSLTSSQDKNFDLTIPHAMDAIFGDSVEWILGDYCGEGGVVTVYTKPPAGFQSPIKGVSHQNAYASEVRDRLLKEFPELGAKMHNHFSWGSFRFYVPFLNTVGAQKLKAKLLRLPVQGVIDRVSTVREKLDRAEDLSGVSLADERRHLDEFERMLKDRLAKLV